MAGRPRERVGRRGVVAEQLRAARAARSMSQEETARELDVNRVTLSLWETGASRPRGPARKYVELWCQQAIEAGSAL